ncbi:DNA-directed DNA polymerase alpha subunit pol12 [Tulasnella sp. 403]|nr:DNA-directed DNA polymerase alpha subunit pol12 [Tulasnella sp. 403]
MGVLCQHLLDQRSFYPLFPVPLDVSGDVNLDLTHFELLSIPETAPDVMILPSRLKEFSKVINGTVFVNPSTTSKFNSLGMVAKL